MKKKIIVFCSIIIIFTLFVFAYKRFLYMDKNVVFNVSKEITNFGTISSNTIIKDIELNVDEYYWDESTIENAKNKFLSLSSYYSSIRKSGVIEDGDGIYAKIYVFDKEKIVYQNIVEIYPSTIDFYSIYYNDMVGKEIGTTSMFGFTYDSNSSIKKEDWMMEGTPYSISIKLTGKLQKETPTLTEENLKKYIVPTMEETLNRELTIKTIEDFNAFIKEELETQIQEKNQGNNRNAIIEFIESQSTNVEVNEKFAIDYANKVILPYFEKDAKDLGLSIEEYANEYWGVSKEDYLKEVGIYEMKKNLVIMDLAKQMNINITKEDLEMYQSKYYNIYAEINGTTILEEQKRIESFPYSFYFMYLQEKVIQSLETQATFSINKILY